LARLKVRETPTRRRKRAAVALARVGQKKVLEVCMPVKRERSKAKFDTSIIRTAMPRRKSTSHNLSPFFNVVGLLIILRTKCRNTYGKTGLQQYPELSIP
jgi:hypothetical protein